MAQDQSVVIPKKIEPKRKFNAWVNNPVLEDYALRYAPKSFRRWSEFSVANSALGGIAFLADFAIGASISISYGFTNAFWGIIAAAIVIFLTGIPIGYYSAKYNVDMDLLTRGAGFGYLGSTLTSLVYATFTFIYFSTEGAIMAQALEVYFRIPLAIGYLISSLAIIPLVLFGMTALSKLQVWTQPIWLILMIAPIIAIIAKDPNTLNHWVQFGGNSPSGAAFNPLFFAMSSGVVLSLITQIGEQADYLRFMPNQTKKNRRIWLWAVLLSGPGWIILGAFKQLSGSFLASYISESVGLSKANEPIQMFIKAFGEFIPGTFLVLTIATFFVILSQVKINVTNAYSGSLSWSNFFSRLLHFHPGRVVWLIFQIAIAIALMEAGVFNFLNTVLGFYSNVAVAWIGAIVADLVINKKLLKISPPYIEFKRAHLYNFNPVGFGSMIIASVVSLLAYFGMFGAFLQAFSPYLSLILAFVLAPIIAIATKGKYYIARENPASIIQGSYAPQVDSARLQHHVHNRLDGEINCTACSFDYEHEDITYCPFHEGMICSLCCSLEKDCHDMCKKTN
ncbi:purine-cytosine permease family protein [Bacillota bacterium Lsc_1132]